MSSRDSRGLGRGLQALLSAQANTVAPTPGTGERRLPLAAIRAGSSQPRRCIQSLPLEELAASIKANGVIQPIVVRPTSGASMEPGRFEIVAGERRWQAAKLAGLVDIPVVIRELSDQEAVAVALIENIQREELTPAEEARALTRLIAEFSLTHEQVATAVGRSRAAVTNLIRLLDLPVTVLELVDTKALSMGHARALLGLADDAERTRLGKLVVTRGLSVRETENLVRRALQGEGAAPKAQAPITNELLRSPRVTVHLQQRESGAGRLVVEFKDSVTRDEIIKAIRSVMEDEKP